MQHWAKMNNPFLYHRSLSIHPKTSENLGVFSDPYFPVFGLSTGKYGAEKIPKFSDVFREHRKRTVTGNS